MSEARHVLDRYLQRTGLRSPSDAAQQFQVTLLRQWIDHLDEVLDSNGVDPQLRMTIIREFIYGTVPENAEAELRTAMHQEMKYWAERARIQGPAGIPRYAGWHRPPSGDDPGQAFPPVT